MAKQTEGNALALRDPNVPPTTKQPKSAKQKRKSESTELDNDKSKLKSKKTKTGKNPTDGIDEITLDCESDGKVPIFDTCSDLRRKMNLHLKLPGVTQAGIARNLTKITPATGTTEIIGFKGEDADRKITPRQIKAFVDHKGVMDGAEGPVFYAGYIYFEKMRIANKKEKSKKRKEMEGVHDEQGVERIDGRASLTCRAGERPHIDQYGKFSIR